jgi:hypothetical protein
MVDGVDDLFGLKFQSAFFRLVMGKAGKRPSFKCDPLDNTSCSQRVALIGSPAHWVYLIYVLQVACFSWIWNFSASVATRLQQSFGGRLAALYFTLIKSLGQVYPDVNIYLKSAKNIVSTYL